MRRLKTVRRPPIYPKTPGHLPCSSLTHPLPLSSRRPSVSFGGFGLRRKARKMRDTRNAAATTERASTIRLTATSQGSIALGPSRSNTTIGDVSGKNVRNLTTPAVGFSMI